MNYWVVIDRRKFGPLTLEEARRMPLRRDSYVWHRGLATWKRADEVAEFVDIFVEKTAGDTGDTVEMPADDAKVDAAPRYPVPPPPPPPGYHDKIRFITHGQRPPKPPTYMGWSIAALICCCLIPGIVAVIYASKVTPLYERGDYDASRQASERAGLWLILSFTLGLVALPFQIVFSLF